MTESTFRLAFVVLLAGLFAMRLYFMLKVRRSGGRIMPDDQAVAREGGRGVFIVRVVIFFLLIAFLVMFIAGMTWIDAFAFPLPAWLRWVGFALGLLSVAFWTWTQVKLDTQWSAQLQLTRGHHLVTSGPYALMRHPLYTAMFGWCISLALLTANWIFVVVAVFSIAALVWRVPKEEQMMIEAFGEEYKAYMQRTGRFFPRGGK
jgi:protein-S-isoprenylcysteine O-methyltransferase Ste14